MAAQTVKLLRSIDATCDRFERDWLAGQQPRIEDYLSETGSVDRPAMLAALMQVQQELILAQFESPADGIEFAEATNSLIELGHATETAEPRNPGSQDVARVVLAVTAGPHQGQRFEFDRHETLLVGRSKQARLKLESDAHFSRHHLRLEINPPIVHLIDLDSRNGTFVNGERVHERSLCHGDVISGGNTVLKLTIDDPARTLDAKSDSKDDSPLEVNSTEKKGALPRIPGYEMLEVMGQVPLGTTYRAYQKTTGQERIVKILKPALKASEKSIQVFLREARILSKLNHRNLISLLDTGAVNGTPYLVTEAVSILPWDETLAAAVPESRIRMACGVACQILDGLQYAHTRSLVHRDIQPSNILVIRQDHKLIAKLSDFGFAKCYTDAGFSQMTHDGTIIGSLPYVSPEQFMDSRHAKPSCDIYSMGATLYRLLAGHDPFVFNKSRCKFLAILEDDPIPLSESFPQVPPVLAAIVHRALAKQPSDRYVSAAEMRQALLPFSRRNA